MTRTDDNVRFEVNDLVSDQGYERIDKELASQWHHHLGNIEGSGQLIGYEDEPRAAM